MSRGDAQHPSRANSIEPVPRPTACVNHGIEPDHILQDAVGEHVRKSWDYPTQDPKVLGNAGERVSRVGHGGHRRDRTFDRRVEAQSPSWVISLVMVSRAVEFDRASGLNSIRFTCRHSEGVLDHQQRPAQRRCPAHCVRYVA